MNYLPAFISPQLVEALGWTILHSLWQGALIAITLSILMILLHRHSARIRYTVAITALFTALLLAGITFIRTYQEVQQPTTSSKLTVQVAPVTITNPAGNTLTKSPTSPTTKTVLRGAILVNFRYYFSKHLPVVVLVWLLGALTMLLKFLGGLAYVQRLKYYKTYSLGTHWNTRLTHLAQSLRVTKPIRLFESTLVKTPLVIGYLKPVILLPFGTIAGLSPEQVEAILAHELAHIYRKDYLLNMLQTLVEILFFFHPAIWWISDYVRVERENCCDDQAIAVCGNPLTYARALANLETMAVKTPRLALAFAGKDGSLLGRIKRLVQQPNLHPTFSEGFLAACVLLIGLTIISASAFAGFNSKAKYFKLHRPDVARAIQPQKTTPAIYPQAESNLKASIFSYTDSLTGKKSDLVIIKNKKGDITELYVDGQKIPKSNINDFRKEIDAALTTTRRAPLLKPAQVPQQLARTKEALKNLETENNNLSYSFEGDLDDFDKSIRAPLPAPDPIFPVLPAHPITAPLPPVPPKVKSPLDYLRSKEVTEKTLLIIDGKKTRKSKGYDPLTGITNKNIRSINVLKGKNATQKYGTDGQDGVVEITTGAGKGYFFTLESEEQEEIARRHKELMREHVRIQTEEHQAQLKEQQARLREHKVLQREQLLQADNAARLEEHKERMKEHEILMKEQEIRMQEQKEHAARFEKIKKELVRDKLIDANNKKLSIQVNQDEFILNGVKQPATVYDKYKKLFFPDRKDWSGSFSESINIVED